MWHHRGPFLNPHCRSAMAKSDNCAGHGASGRGSARKSPKIATRSARLSPRRMPDNGLSRPVDVVAPPHITRNSWDGTYAGNSLDPLSEMQCGELGSRSSRLSVVRGGVSPRSSGVIPSVFGFTAPAAIQAPTPRKSSSRKRSPPRPALNRPKSPPAQQHAEQPHHPPAPA